MFSLFHRTNVELLYSDLYDEVSFYPRFFKDIKQPRKSVLIESPYLTIRRAEQFASVAAKVSRKGVSIKVFTRYPGHDTPRLRAEAEETLVSYRRRQDDAMKEAEAIVSEAKALAARLRKEAEIELEANLKRHKQAALDRISFVQEEAAAEIRNYLLTEALGEVRTKMEKAANTADASKMIDAIIADLPHLTKDSAA